MKTIRLTLILIIGLLIANCTNSSKKDKIEQRKEVKPVSLLDHTILENEVYDASIKTQVQLDVLILDKVITEKRIRDLLTSLYDKTINRSGFKYHTNPTNVYIYVYTSKEKAESGMGQWIGMISKSYSDTHSKIDVSKIQLNSLKLKPIPKFGLSSSLRIEIWNKSIKNEDKAQKMADKKYSLEKAGITMEDIKQNITMSDKLKVKYKKEMAAEYGIEIAIIDSIGIEGITKGWPFPKY